VIEASLLAVALAIPSGALLLRTGRDRLIRDRMRQKVVVTLKSQATFSGVLFEVDDRSLVLRNAQALGEGDPGIVPLDGEVVLARADVEFLQRP
jgi:small nuclear ribonucleoprotein (snRNP)-like protein